MKYEYHGKRNSKEYKAWSEMRQRCNNKNNDKYKYYGERGIRVCLEWNKSFAAFYEYMGDCPNKCTLERINVEKGYGPGNCKWATLIEQARNKRNNRRITYNGITKCMAEWAEIYNLKQATLHRRLKKGMNPPECFLPVGAIPRGGSAHIAATNRQGNI